MTSQNNSQGTVASLPPRKGRSSILPKLSVDAYQKMITYIECGAYNYIAAGAIGISSETFRKWMQKGQAAKNGIYRTFFLDITEAQDYARMAKEIEVYETSPQFWLSRGPGRTKPGLPGWTEEISIAASLEVSIQEPGSKDQLEAIAPLSTFAKALAVLEDMGYFKRTESGDQFFKTLDAPSEQSESPNEPSETGDSKNTQ